MRYHRFVAVLICACTGFAEVAAAADPPPDVVTSDTCQNTAMGTGALSNETFGSLNCPNDSGNTGAGWFALNLTTTGTINTAFGADTLSTNKTGSANTAIGFNALYSNDGDSNTAAGYSALADNSTGTQNTGFGAGTLAGNSTGSNNIALGYFSGQLIRGSNNIVIGNDGAIADNGAVRIGTKGKQKAVYVAGIYTTPLEANSLPVYVNAGGRLSVGTSSERYKTGIVPMGGSSAGLEQLRPVTFRLRTDPRGAIQYGLIAEEVAKVYPALVIRDEAGNIQGVRYDELAPMLLNEVQRQQARLSEQAMELGEMRRQLADQRRSIEAMHAALSSLGAQQ